MIGKVLVVEVLSVDRRQAPTDLDRHRTSGLDGFEALRGRPVFGCSGSRRDDAMIVYSSRLDGRNICEAAVRRLRRVRGFQ